MKELFLFKELLCSMRVKTWTLSLGVVFALTIFLAALALFSVLVQPIPSSERVRMVAIPRPDLSQAELTALHEQLWNDPAIAQVQYVLPPDTESAHALSQFEITLRAESELAPVTERLMGWGAFQQVGPRGAGFLEAWRDWLQHSEKRWLAFSGLLVLLIASLLAIYGGLLAARQNFAGELEILDLSGVAPPTLRIPFALLGILYGVTSALLVGFVLNGVRGLLGVSAPGYASHWESVLVEYIGLRGFLLGLLFSAVAGVLGWLSIQKYPSPFKRSRMSSSSAAVTED